MTGTTTGAFFVMFAPNCDARLPIVEGDENAIRYFETWDDADEARREHPMGTKLGYQVLHCGDYP